MAKKKQQRTGGALRGIKHCKSNKGSKNVVDGTPNKDAAQQNAKTIIRK